MPFVARRFIFRVVLFIVILLLAVSFLLTKSPKSREKTDKDLNLKKKRNLSKNEVDLVIVEEHHEGTVRVSSFDKSVFVCEYYIAYILPYIEYYTFTLHSIVRRAKRVLLFKFQFAR